MFIYYQFNSYSEVRMLEFVIQPKYMYLVSKRALNACNAMNLNWMFNSGILMEVFFTKAYLHI